MHRAEIRTTLSDTTFAAINAKAGPRGGWNRGEWQGHCPLPFERGGNGCPGALT